MVLITDITSDTQNNNEDDQQDTNADTYFFEDACKRGIIDFLFFCICQHIDTVLRHQINSFDYFAIQQHFHGADFLTCFYTIRALTKKQRLGLNPCSAGFFISDIYRAYG